MTNTENELRLEQVIAAFLAAEDAGSSIDREGLMATHSDIADELQRFFRGHDRIGRLAAPFRAAAAPAVLDTTDALTVDLSPRPPSANGSHPVAANGNGLVEPENDRRARVRYFGDYELIEKLGQGGMGVVYKARQVSLNRSVALKMLKSDLLVGDDDLRRFQNEAEVNALLDHPHIVPILEVGEHIGRRYLSMKLICGPSLDKKLADYAADPWACARLVATVAEAVHHAHQRGVLHRDLKPSNILVDDGGAPYVTDFGLAKRVEGDNELTHSGAILGTPAYMAPEQTSGRRGAMTTATDVYGLGALLYALLTGKAPFGGDSVMDTLHQVRERSPELPGRLNANVPRDLEVICLKCLEKVPARRYGSAQALADDLHRYVNAEPIQARSVGPLERAWLWCKRRPAVAGLLTALVLALFASTGVSLAYAREQSKVARQQADRAREQTESAQNERLLRDQAVAERDRTARLSYVNAINLAWHEWRDGNLSRVSALLDATRPQRNGAADYRGFEWSYLDRLGRTALWTFTPKEVFGPSIAFSPDGAWIAVARNHRKEKTSDIGILDAHTGREIRTIAANPVSLSSIAISPDGAWIASTRDDRSIVIWESRTGAEVMRLPGDDMARVIFSRDGRLLASLGTKGGAPGNGEVKIWDLAGRREIRSSKMASHVYTFAFSPDGRMVATSAGEVQVADVLTKKVIWKTAKDHTMTDVAFSPDGKLLAAASFDGWIGIWNAVTGVRDATFYGHRGWVNRLAFSPDGRRLASGGRDRIVRIWDVASGRTELELRGFQSHVWDLVFSPDGSQLAAVSFVDGVVNVWDSRQKQEAIELVKEGTSGTGFPTFELAFSTDGRILAAAQSAGAVRAWDMSRRAPLFRLEPATENGRNWVALGPQTDLLATLDEKRSIVLRNTTTGALIRTLDSSEGSGRCRGAFSPDGRFLAATSGLLLTIRIWEVATGHLSAILQGHTGAVECLAFSPDGRKLASGSLDTTVRLWDVSSRQEQLVYRGHSHGVAAVAFSPDGKTLASSHFNPTKSGEIQLWEVSTGRSRSVLQGHAGFVRKLAYIGDGRRLASLGDDGLLKIWDIETGQETLSLPAHTRNGIGMAVRPDGSQIATSGAEGSVFIWDATTIAVRPDGPG